MEKKILINRSDPEECRIATVKNGRLEDFTIETAARENTRGNIYKGIVARVEPSLQAAFVDYGASRHGFLQRNEIHQDYYQDNIAVDKERRLSIQQAVKSGQELLLQVTKEETGNKGAMLTTLISLAGRYVVLMPGSATIGISRKIEDEKERKRLKEVVGALKIPQGFGVIVRTVGEKQTKTALSRDLQYLLRLWQTINKLGISKRAPDLLYKERNLVIRSIRDRFTADVKEILVDDKIVFQDVKQFMKAIAPRQVDTVKLYKGQKPLFTKYQLEDQIAAVFARRVSLKSGGSIVIDCTEALVAIDVNSGKATREKSIESTAFKTNLEAAEEVARQLRLRDLGGLIVIDFIDMRDKKHKAAVEKALKTNTKEDKARISLGRLTKFGLMEMSRQRVRPPIEYGTYIPCSFCHGRGMIPSVETLALAFLRKLRSAAIKGKNGKVNGSVPVNVAEYLLNKKRKELLDIEQQHNLRISICGDEMLSPGEDRIVCEKEQQ
jgi:ribonuclease E